MCIFWLFDLITLKCDILTHILKHEKQQYEATEYVYRIFIDGELKFEETNPNPNPLTFFNVECLMGNFYAPENFAASFGWYRNLEFNSFATEGKNRG